MQAFVGICLVLALVARLSARELPLQYDYVDDDIIDALEQQVPWPINESETPLTTGNSKQYLTLFVHPTATACPIR